MPEHLGNIRSENAGDVHYSEGAGGRWQSAASSGRLRRRRSAGLSLGTGAHVGRDTRIVPEVLLLDLKLRRLHGFEVLPHPRR